MTEGSWLDPDIDRIVRKSRDAMRRSRELIEQTEKLLHQTEKLLLQSRTLPRPMHDATRLATSATDSTEP